MEIFCKNIEKTCCQIEQVSLLSALMHRFGVFWVNCFYPFKTHKNDSTTTMQEELIDEN